MNEPAPARLFRWLPVGILAAVLLIIVGGGFALLARARPMRPIAPLPPPPELTEATSEQVHRACAYCHAYPPPESFPRFAWRKEVKQGFDFLHKDQGLRLDDYPSMESVIRYYERRAPEAFPPPTPTAASPSPVRFDRQGFSIPDAEMSPGVSHVSLERLSGSSRPDVLVCDATANQVLLLQTGGGAPVWRVLARGLCCARAEVADLDGDGVKDILLACLGNFNGTFDRVGSVVWLKGSADGTYTPVTLLDGVGRVADVRAADFNGDGKLDLAVAVFGWRSIGEILYLENQTTDWSRPVFVPQVVDPRHGTTDVKVADLNGDGQPDLVALITQEHETAVAYLNQGSGRFEAKTIWAAPHPAYGCNGLQLVDLDGDSDLDVLVTTGDALDAPYLLKPYHGIWWLENRAEYPFVAHRLADMYGAGAPVAADLDGDGDLDVVASSFLPDPHFPRRGEQQLDALIWLEQAAPGKFVRHVLEKTACDHLSCAVADMDGDGRADLVLGSHIERGRPHDEAVTILYNRGKDQGLQSIPGASAPVVP